MAGRIRCTRLLLTQQLWILGRIIQPAVFLQQCTHLLELMITAVALVFVGVQSTDSWSHTTETNEGGARAGTASHGHHQQGVGATGPVESVQLTPRATVSTPPAQRFDIAWNSPWPAGCPPGSVEPVPDFARYGVRMGKCLDVVTCLVR